MKLCTLLWVIWISGLAGQVPQLLIQGLILSLVGLRNDRKTHSDHHASGTILTPHAIYLILKMALLDRLCQLPNFQMGEQVQRGSATHLACSHE